MFRQFVKDQKGHSLFELSISLPIMVFLTFTMGTLFLWSMKCFVYEIADWTLQEELFSVMDRIVHEARTADKVKINNMSYPIEKYDSISFWKPRCYPDSQKNFTHYFAYQPIHTASGTWKICRQDISTPITGDSIFCRTHIMKFRCRFIPPARIRIELKGASLITGHAMETQAELFLPEMMKHAEDSP